jgi:hypothetical protein
MGFFAFWLYNTGLFIPLSLTGIFLSKADRSFRPLASAGGVLFLVALLFNLQPYFYDNLKTFTYAVLFLAPFAGLVLERLMKEPRLPKAVGAGVALLLLLSQTASALIDLNSFHNGLQSTLFFSREEIELADRFKALRSGPDALTLINPRHNHWIPCLTGSPVLMGYPGWLWTWGIVYSKREAEVRSLLSGSEAAESLIRKYGLKYAVLSPSESRPEQPIAFGYFESRFKKIIDSANWKVYSLDEKAMSPSTSVR